MMDEEDEADFSIEHDVSEGKESENGEEESERSPSNSLKWLEQQEEGGKKSKVVEELRQMLKVLDGGKKSKSEEELRQKLKIEEGGKKEQGRKGGRLEGLGKSRMATVKKFVLVVDSLFEVPKSKLGSLDRDIIAWFRENYGILELNEDKYGKKFSFGMLQEDNNVEDNNVVVICHGHMLVLKKSWFKVKWTLFRQKQLEDLESSWEANTCFGTWHSGASKRCFGTWHSGTSKTCFETRSGTSKTCFGARHSRRKHAW